MQIKKIHAYNSLLGDIKIEATIDVIDGEEFIFHNEIMRIERIIAYKFYKKAIKKDILSPKEVEGIVYFLGINMNKLASMLRIDRSTLTNIIHGRRPSKMICERLLTAVEKELLFPNYHKSRFENGVECELDRNYFDLIIKNKVA